jgi:MOSC domain-containing protein YiiM
MGSVVAVNRSERRTDPKVNVGEGELLPGVGLKGDAHAGLNEREVSLIDVAEIERANREYAIEARPGSFADNLTLEGVDLSALQVGDRLRVGPALLEVVQLGKPRSLAHTYNFEGVSILPDVGVFCRVLEGGHIERGDPAEVVS